MSLSYLQQHIPAQREAISKLAPVLTSVTTTCAYWNKFREGLWGKDPESLLLEEQVDRDDDPIEAIPCAPSITRSVATVPEGLPSSWSVYSKKILVRSEYEEAEKAAVSTNSPNINVFVVRGQPGIGKSIFLLWLLMRRLALQLPTISQISASYAILFHEAGVSEFRNLDHNPAFNALMGSGTEHLSRIWALVDTNPALPEPANIFKHATPFFVVRKLSSDSKHTDWLHKIGCKQFYMKPWSGLEVIQARSFLGEIPHTERQLWHLHTQFGASARTLAFYGDDPDNYEATVHETINQMWVSRLLHAFRNPGSIQDAEYIITVHPSQTTRMRSEKRFASQHVFDLIWETHLRGRIDATKELNDLFLTSPIAASSAGWVFKNRMHDLLIKDQYLSLGPILGRRTGRNFVYDNYTSSRRRTNRTGLDMTNSEEHRLVEKAKLKMNCYYRPNPSNPFGIDSLLLTRSYGRVFLLTFQFIWNEREHHTEFRGFDKIDELEFPSDARRYHVVVTPEGVYPRIVVPVRQSGTDEPQDKSMDGDEDMGGGHDNDTNGEQWVPFSVFHLSVNMGKLFTPKL